MSTPTMNSVTTTTVPLTGDSSVDALVSGSRWRGDLTGTTSLTYSFPTSANVWAGQYSELDEPSGFQPFGLTQRNGARTALELWSRYANITFTETTDNASNVGDIRFASTTVDDEDSTAHAYYPGFSPAAGDVWLESGFDPSLFGPGEAGSFILLHEIGHTLGLKHPFEASSRNSTTLDADFDTVSFTIMSYNLYPDISFTDHAISFLPTTPMLLDIQAIRHIYGEKPFNASDTQYIFNENTDYFETIYDTGGNDTIIWNSNEQFAIIDLLGGAWSSLGNALYTYNAQGQIVETDIFNVAIYYDTVIENVISGASDDDIYGNEVGNRLDGGGGHDNIWGDAGADTLLGGGGNDHIYGQSPGGGTDGVDSISGGDGSDYLQGNAGNDSLDGGEGSDRVNGGKDDDLITGAGGNDSVNGNLGADTISGGDGNDSLRGGQGADSISGGSGNDLLSGDLGADTLSGGEGGDLFTFSGAGSALGQPDRILDYADGTDRLSIGFAPTAILTGAVQSGAATAATTAQQLFNARAGDGEVAALMVGSDTYLFYAANGGATVDSAILMVGTNALLFTIADFG